MKCYVCGKFGHFARKCSERKVSSSSLHGLNYVSSTMILTDFSPLWIVDSGATDHVARDRSAYVEFRRLNPNTRRLYMGNGAFVEVIGIDTYKLMLQSNQAPYLHHVLYAPEIQRNLISIRCLDQLGYSVYWKTLKFSFMIMTVFWFALV